MSKISESTNIDWVQVQEQAGNPATPSTGYGRIYAKSDGLYFIDDAGAVIGPLIDAAGAAGDSTKTAAYGSRPAASNDGDLFFPSDGFYVERDTGAAWVPWGPLFPMTAPVDGDYAWINQGTASVVTTYGGIALRVPGGAGTGWRIRKKSAPGTPYTITAALLMNFPIHNATDLAAGLCFRQSSDGKLHILALYWAAGGGPLAVWNVKYTNPTTISASYFLVNSPFASNPVFMRIADNATNRILSLSADGQNWSQIQSVGRTDFLTADEVGFCAFSSDTTYDIVSTLISWKEG